MGDRASAGSTASAARPAPDVSGCRCPTEPIWHGPRLVLRRDRARQTVLPNRLLPPLDPVGNRRNSLLHPTGCLWPGAAASREEGFPPRTPRAGAHAAAPHFQDSSAPWDPQGGSAMTL